MGFLLLPEHSLHFFVLYLDCQMGLLESKVKSKVHIRRSEEKIVVLAELGKNISDTETCIG